MRLSDRLREETRPEHEALERALDWERRASDAVEYRRWLQRLHGFYRDWEPAVAAVLSDPAFFDPRRKLHLLEDDLATLGKDGRPVPPPTDSARGRNYATSAAALGAMYVLEGSTLGGQLIARHVEQQLGFKPSYHSSYGPAAGVMWRTFKLRLDENVAVRDHEDVIAAATATFVELRILLTRSTDCPPA